MSSEAELKNRIKNTFDIRGLVKTMKTIAAVNMRQYEKTYESMKEYTDSIKKALDLAGGPDITESGGGCFGAIVIGSDMGICGQFNDALAAFVGDKIKGTGARVMTLGQRIKEKLNDTGIRTQMTFEFPRALVSDIIPVINDLVLEIYDWQKKYNVGKAVIYYNKPRGSASYSPHESVLYPFQRDLQADDWDYFYYDEKKELRINLTVQFMFALIYRAFVESLVSENASRLIAMQLAEKNIDEQLTLLTAQYNNERQNSVTSELLDVIAGFESLVKTSK